jgi:mRNA (guanine-N7-)-methyltransferase
MENYRTFRGLGTQRLSKRKREEDHLGPPNKKLASNVGVVAIHCKRPNRFGACLPLDGPLLADNTRPEVGVEKRQESPIIGLKSFNNWIKSVLIKRLADPVLAKSSHSTTYASGPDRRSRTSGVGKVLEMGIGKGGDLNKWLKANIRELVGVGMCYRSPWITDTQARWLQCRYRSCFHPASARSVGIYQRRTF